MHRVVLVSRCSEEALNATRRILDAYGRRLSERTWEAHITDAGLSNLRVLLRRMARKSTAIACHRAEPRGFKLLWLVGNRKRFARDGSCPTRTRKGLHHSLRKKHDFAALHRLAGILSVTGDLHDVGKTTVRFDTKLTNNDTRRDPYRHEFLSLLYSEFQEDSFADRWQAVVHAAQGFNSAENFPLSSYPENDWDLAKYLLVTHHRLPSCEGLHLTCAEHVHIPHDKFNTTQIEGGLAPFKPTGSKKPYALHDKAELLAFNQEKAKLAASLIGSPYEADGLFLWARLALMIADHKGSLDALSYEEGKEPRANPGDAARERKPQGLSAHLRRVGVLAPHVLKRLPRLADRLPGMAREERERMERSTRKSRFAWQNAAARLATQLTQDPGFSDRGLFVCLTASTGSGKTRLGGRLMSLLGGDNLRITVVNGLRSLTLQTGDAYRQQLGIPAENMAVLIGAREAQEIHAAGRDKDEVDAQMDLSVEGFDCEASIFPSALRQELSFRGKESRDRRQLLGAPVLISTIDYLIGAGDWRRAKHILPQLRVLTSDLLMDEIDSYDLADYPAIARLCFVTGLFGRNIYLSSATLMPEIAEPLFAAYQAGRAAYAAVSGASADVQALIASDMLGKAGAKAALIPAGGAEFSAFYQDAMSAIVASLGACTTQNRRGYVLNLSNPGWQKQILSAASDLHKTCASDIPDGPSISVGFIRVARIRDAAALSRWLATQTTALGPDTYLRVIPYHANLLLAVRAQTEYVLDRLLRRDKEEDPVLSSRFARDAQRSGKKRAILIVVATPVEEVGRDHDFDWAILEPSSTRSLAQGAGRVWRHRHTRELKPGAYNIAIMDRPLSALLRKQDVAYTRPGYQRKDSPLPGNTLDIGSLAPATVDSPDARECLRDIPLDGLARYERAQIAAEMRTFVVQDFLQDFTARFSQRHMLAHRFRAGEPQAARYFDLDKNCFVSGNGTVDSDVAMVNIAGSGWYFGSTLKDLEQMVSDLASRMNVEVDAHFTSRYLVTETHAEVKNSAKFLGNPMLGVFQIDPADGGG